MSWIWALPFVLLPLQPVWFMAVAALVGLWGVIRGLRPLAGWFGLAALVGMGGQLLTPTSLYTIPALPEYIQQTESEPQASNLIRPFDLNALHGWNHSDERGGWAVPLGDGFWRLPRYNPESGREQSEFLTDHRYPIVPGQAYTQSFYLRHDGQQARLQITFFTNRGQHNPVPTYVESVGTGVYRVWGSYTAKEGDSSVRAIDLLNQGGDFTYLEIGWAQLEAGTEPGSYRPGHTGEQSSLQRAWAWGSQMLLGWLVLVGGWFWRRYVDVRWVVGFVLLGLTLHLGYALWQLQDHNLGRAWGLTPQPNLLGHTAVMMGGLLQLLGGWRIGLLGLLGAGLGVAVSGSRTAFLALLALGLFWVWSLPRGRRWVLLTLGVSMLVFWRWPEVLGRLGQLGLDSSGQSRLQFWQVAWEAFLQHPVWGIGWSHFPLFFLQNPPPDFIELPTHAHNLVLSLLAEGGITLLVAFLLLTVGVLYRLVAGRSWPVVALWVLALGLNILDYSYFYAGVFGTLWVAVGWALGHVQYRRE